MPHTTTRPRVLAFRARPAALLLAAGGAALAACGQDPLEAASANNLNTIPRDLVVYPFSSAPAPLNTAVSVGGLSAVRPTVAAVLVGQNTLLVPNFDFAVDRAADGRTRLLPAKLLAGLEGTGRLLRVGIQVVTTPFDSLRSAPNSGTYQRDSVTVVGPGQTFVVEAEPASCLSNARTFLYAKFVVDSVSAATGGVYVRAVINPNCGFRSLAPGRPTS